MDQVDRPGQEEFIWAMRSRTTEGDEVMWRDRRFTSTNDWKLMASKSATEETAAEKMYRHGINVTKIISSFLPDELIVDPENMNERIYDAAVSHGNISGLQLLWDKYRAIGKGGPTRMAQVLNICLGIIMQEAFVYNGDVIKCGGQFFTILWKQGVATMADCVHQAVDCGLSIVKNFSNLETDLGVSINVSIGISCGQLTFCAFGSMRRATYVLTGDALEDAKDMVNKAGYNQVMMDQGAWDYLNSIEYIAKAYDDEYDMYIITDFSSAWRSINVGDKTNTERIKKSIQSAASPGSYTSITQVTEIRELRDIYELRPSIGDAVNMKIKDQLKRFIFPPVYITAEAGEPIESLIEMRYMVVLIASFTFEAQSYHEMIKLTDIYYKMINNIIDPYNGYVNRISYSENELIFYIIFGIHGDKGHDSRNALKAAMKCFKGSENSNYLNMLSMAVVSGWAFCGPVGHQMRREYVIIGGNVRRALRLIVEYPNQVTCDLETFLRSKMNSRHFILQERKAKETDLGCIYQYVDIESTNRLPKFSLNKYPLLDREYEVDVFVSLVQKITKTHRNSGIQNYRMRYEPSALFILGGPHSGKTRLLEELVSVTSAEFPMFRLLLIPLDKYVPYQTIYYLFGIPLGIAENSTISDREAKLASKLKHLPLDGLECVLNTIFRVNFPKIPVIDTLRNDELRSILENVIKYLCRICFTRPWVIFIDDADNIDLESWDLLYPIMESNLIILVVFIGCQRHELPRNAQHTLLKTKSKCIELLPLDNLFLTTLVCQMLECSAIPIQLEKIIQERSEGNPGWIQNYLLALIHKGIICIKKVDSLGEFKDDLILPAVELMSRDCFKLKPATLYKPTRSILESAILLHRKKWEIFQSIAVRDEEEVIDEIKNMKESGNKLPSVMDTPTNSNESRSGIGPRRTRRTNSSGDSLHRNSRSSAAKISTGSVREPEEKKFMNICVLLPGGERKLIDYNIVNFDQANVLDGLTSLEMTVLKCASVIGDFFLRDMLISIISCTNEREVSLACQHLFELRILACAEGDFRRSVMNHAPVMTDRFKIYEDAIITCNCVGFLISESCRGMVRYANCGYMRFLNQEYRDASYKSLTTPQLVLLHTKAMNFLEKSTRKCIACGNGDFTKIYGNRYEEGVLAQKKIRSRSTKPDQREDGVSSSSILENWDVVGHAGHSNVSRSSSPKRYDRKSKSYDAGVIFQVYTKHGLNTEKNKEAPPFEDSDFTCCECDKILKCVYYQIRKHYEVTERYDKWLHATLEYAALCTEDYNVALSLKCLNHALEIIQGPYKEIANPGEAWKYNVMKAQVYAEIGRARFVMGQTRSAYEAYENALQFYGYRLPRPSSLRFKLMEFWEFIKILTKSRHGIGIKFGYVAQFCDNVSTCLGMITTLFIDLKMWDNAFISALWSLRKALQSEKNFITLINAFANLIYVASRKRKYRLCEPLELMALDYCRRYKCTTDVNDMKSVAKLYSAIFCYRIQKARLDDAFTIGISVDRLTDTLYLHSTLIRLFPLFFEMLLLKSEVNEMINAMLTFEQVVSIAEDYNGEVCFHSLSVYFHLQTGYTLVNIKYSEEYYYTQNKRLIDLKEPAAEQRYFVAIWLWYLRTENWDIANIWEQKLPNQWIVHPDESVSNLITGLMYIEGLITLATYKVDRKMLWEVDLMFIKIAQLIKKLEEQAQSVKIIGPRLYHLKAFFHMCRMEEYKGWEALDKAMKLAQNTGNLFDASWANHSERAWKQDMPEVLRNNWRDHAYVDNYHEVESIFQLVHYTLEPPMYI